MSFHNKKFVILISGPTATGKSDFVVQLSNYLPLEIINADVGSFYTNLSIGTAKPDWKNQLVPHHFFDILDQPINWTAPQFRESLKIIIEEIWARGNIPVVVGGSAFYIQSFFFKNYELPTPSQQLIDALEQESTEKLWQRLDEIDQDRAIKINKNDRYRIIRALAIWHTLEQKPSEFEQKFDPIAPFYFVTLSRDRDELYKMINERVTSMMQAGWLDEVRQLIDMSYEIDELAVDEKSWSQFLCKKKMIGYDLLLQYLQGNFSEQDLSQVTDLIAQRTRNYAKRQITFLKKLVTTIQKAQANHKNNGIAKSVVEVCNLTLCDLSLYIKQLSERILQF